MCISIHSQDDDCHFMKVYEVINNTISLYCTFCNRIIMTFWVALKVLSSPPIWFGGGRRRRDCWNDPGTFGGLLFSTSINQYRYINKCEAAINVLLLIILAHGVGAVCSSSSRIGAASSSSNSSKQVRSSMYVVVWYQYSMYGMMVTPKYSCYWYGTTTYWLLVPSYWTFEECTVRIIISS